MQRFAMARLDLNTEVAVRLHAEPAEREAQQQTA
jgi:hypothetical protein